MFVPKMHWHTDRTLAHANPKSLTTVKTAEIRRQFNTGPGENPDTLAVELRQFSCRPEKI